MTVHRIPLSALQSSVLVPEDVSGNTVTFIQEPDGYCGVVIPTENGSTVYERCGGDDYHVHRWKDINGTVYVSGDLPIGSSLLESAITACRNYIDSSE